MQATTVWRLATLPFALDQPSWALQAPALLILAGRTVSLKLFYWTRSRFSTMIDSSFPPKKGRNLFFLLWFFSAYPHKLLWCLWFLCNMFISLSFCMWIFPISFGRFLEIAWHLSIFFSCNEKLKRCMLPTLWFNITMLYHLFNSSIFTWFQVWLSE